MTEPDPPVSSEDMIRAARESAMRPAPIEPTAAPIPDDKPTPPPAARVGRRGATPRLARTASRPALAVMAALLILGIAIAVFVALATATP